MGCVGKVPGLRETVKTYSMLKRKVKLDFFFLVFDVVVHVVNEPQIDAPRFLIDT